MTGLLLCHKTLLFCRKWNWIIKRGRVQYITKSTLYYPELSSHRYSVIFSADSGIFAFSAIIRAVPADFNFDISGHNWFSDEHFWASLNQRWTLLESGITTKTIKIAKKGAFFQYWCWKDKKSKISEWISIGFFKKNSKNMIFWKYVIPFVSMTDNFLPEKNGSKIPK